MTKWSLHHHDHAGHALVGDRRDVPFRLPGGVVGIEDRVRPHEDVAEHDAGEAHADQVADLGRDPDTRLAAAAVRPAASTSAIAECRRSRRAARAWTASLRERRLVEDRGVPEVEVGTAQSGSATGGVREVRGASRARGCGEQGLEQGAGEPEHDQERRRGRRAGGAAAMWTPARARRRGAASGERQRDQRSAGGRRRS